jgi:hypothetical protein
VKECCGLNIIEELSSPPDEYRPYPFWFWNGDMTEDEITFQVKECLQQGITSVLIHPRHGLITPYMSKEYMDLVLHTVRIADSLGMKVWLYDEYNWPSGTVAGRLLHDYPEYKMKYLRYDYVETDSNEPINLEWADKEDLVCITGCNLSTGEIWSFPANGEEFLEKLTGKWGIAAFYVVFPSIQLDCVRGHRHAIAESGYIDVLNPEAVKQFVRLTHEKYYETLHEYFGTVIQGIFTDEPGMIYDFDFAYDWDGALSRHLPWTERLESTFFQKKGYSLESRLIHLIADVPGAIKTRLDYWEVITALYEESYHKQISSWCEERDIAYLGHVVCEEPLAMGLHYQGDMYKALRHFHVPGTDWTSDRSGLENISFINAKMVSSVAHRSGRKLTVCETYATSGWDLTLRDMKRVVDWLYMLGINGMCLHGFFYTICGFRRNECPPSEFFQSPWWKHMREYSNYVARLGFLLSQGRHVCNVGVLVPTQTYWGRNNRTSTIGNADEKWTMASDGFERVCKSLVKIGIDYDLIFDCGIDGIAGGSILWGDELIDTLVIPPVEFLTFDLWADLSRFLEQGGKVVLIDDAPYVLSADKESIWLHSEDVRKIITTIISSDDALPFKRTLHSELSDGSIEIRNGEEICEEVFVVRRCTSEGVVCFANNHSSKSVDSCDLIFDGVYSVMELDLDSMKISTISVSYERGRTIVKSPFRAYQSRVFLLTQDSIENELITHDEIVTEEVNERIIELGPNWDFCLEKENAFRVSDLIRIPFASEDGADIYFHVYCDELIDDVRLLLEKSCTDSIFINGVEVLSARIPYRYCDCGQVAIDVADYMNAGLNKFSLKYKMQPKEEVISPLMAYSGIHSISPLILLIGEFTVTSKGYLAPCVRRIRNGVWQEQGFPYYAGTGVYRTRIHLEEGGLGHSAFVACDVGGDCVETIVNGVNCGTRVWEPYVVDVTDALKLGENLIELRVTGTALNLLMPLDNEMELRNSLAFLRGGHKSRAGSGVLDACFVIRG